MSKLNKRSLIKLVSRNFTDIERQFAGKLAIYLEQQISEHRKVAMTGKYSSIIPRKKSLLITVTLRWLTAVIGATLGVLITSLGIGLVGVVLVGVAALATAGIIYLVSKLLKHIPKRKIEQDVKRYSEFFPRDNDIIKLISQLASLSQVDKLNATPHISEFLQKTPPVFQLVKKIRDKIIDSIFIKRKVSLQDKKEAIQAKIIQVWVEKEFQKIWDIFKKFTCDKEAYNSFKEGPWSKKITNLFAEHCDLGDPTDRSEIVSDWEINILWINVFGRYLEEKEPEMRESVLTLLESKFNVSAETSFISNADKENILNTGKEKLNALEFQPPAMDYQSGFLNRQTFFSLGVKEADPLSSANQRTTSYVPIK